METRVSRYMSVCINACNSWGGAPAGVRVTRSKIRAVALRVDRRMRISYAPFRLCLIFITSFDILPFYVSFVYFHSFRDHREEKPWEEDRWIVCIMRGLDVRTKSHRAHYISSEKKTKKETQITRKLSNENTRVTCKDKTQLRNPEDGRFFLLESALFLYLARNIVSNFALHFANKETINFLAN